MDVSHWLVAAITAVIAAVAGSGLGVWLLKAYQTWHGNRRKDKKDAWDRQAELIERQDEHIKAQQIKLDRRFAAEALCQQQLARLKEALRWMYDLLVRQHQALEKAKLVCEPLPAFPDLDNPSLYDAEQEYDHRATLHTTQLIGEQAQQLKEEGQP